MIRKIFVLHNSFAGGKVKKITKALSQYLTSQNILYQLFDTDKLKNAEDVIRQNLNHTFTDLIIVGGDGTINESINGLDSDIPVSIIPAGTGDDFSKMISLGNGIKEQFETALNGTIQTIDLGICNKQKFINGVGIGFDGQIVEDMAVKKVPLLKGHAAYYYHVLRILGSYKERTFEYKIDGTPYKKDLILLTIGNGSTFGGGFKLMPEAKLNDGWLEVCEIGRFAPIKRFLNIHRLSSGTHGTLPRVNFYKTQRISVSSDAPLFAHIDGERMGPPPYQISILPNSLKIRVKQI